MELQTKFVDIIEQADKSEFLDKFGGTSAKKQAFLDNLGCARQSMQA